MNARERFDGSLRLAESIARRKQDRYKGTLEPADILQGALLGLWRAALEFDGRSAWPAFASFRIRGGIIDWAVRPSLGRGERCRWMAHRDGFEEAADDLELRRASDRDDLEQVLRQLDGPFFSLRERVSVRLQMDGMSDDDIAEAMACSRDVVQSRRYQTRRKLLAML